MSGERTCPRCRTTWRDWPEQLGTWKTRAENAERGLEKLRAAVEPIKHFRLEKIQTAHLAQITDRVRAALQDGEDKGGDRG